MKLQFLEVWGVDFNSVDECYGIVANQPETIFYKILGQFFWDGKLAADGALVLSQDQLNTILGRCPFTFRLVKDGIAYAVNKTTQAERTLLNGWDYTVKIIDLLEDEEDEDEYIYGLVELKDKAGRVSG